MWAIGKGCKGQLQETLGGGTTVEGQNALKRVITKLRVRLVLRKCLLVFFQGVNGRLLWPALGETDCTVDLMHKFLIHQWMPLITLLVHQ